MNRKQRTKILVNSDLDFLQKISDLIKENHIVKDIESPNKGLVMMKMRESAQKHLFYIGEILVTESKVMIDDNIGLGILQGANLKKAYHLAVIDAAYNSNIKELEEINSLIIKKGKEIKKKDQIKVNKILETKVNFETLDEEVKA
ncbi:MAG: phosphonate C-P lyase system protein PhnG [Eubacteriales bacterium]